MITSKVPHQRRGKYHILDIKSRAIDLWMDSNYDGHLEEAILKELKNHRESLSCANQEMQPDKEGIWNKDSFGWYRIDV